MSPFLTKMTKMLPVTLVHLLFFCSNIKFELVYKKTLKYALAIQDALSMNYTPAESIGPVHKWKYFIILYTVFKYFIM